MRVGVWGDDYCEFNLGKSKNGIHFVAFVDDHQCFRLHVWFLDESGGKMEWVLKRDISVRDVVDYFWHNPDDRTGGSWILQHDAFYPEDNQGPDAPIVEESLDWDSDDDGAIGIKDCDARDLWGCRIFGFHHFKHIVFLENSRVLFAHHFDSSKVQDLGVLLLNYPGHLIDTTFIYTPCWAGDLSENN